MPWLVAGLPLAAQCLRMVRATLPEVLSEDYVRTATAKGLTPRRITFLHTLPVALPPTTALIGGYIPIMLANVILVEAVFGIPGIYRLIPSAVDGRNFPVLMAIVIVASMLVVVFNALADILLAALDPRVRGSPVERAAVAEEAAGRSVVGQLGRPHDARRALLDRPPALAHVGVRPAGADGVDEDAVPAQLAREDAGERVQAGLADAVGGRAAAHPVQRRRSRWRR